MPPPPISPRTSSTRESPPMQELNIRSPMTGVSAVARCLIWHMAIASGTRCRASEAVPAVDSPVPDNASEAGLPAWLGEEGKVRAHNGICPDANVPASDEVVHHAESLQCQCYRDMGRTVCANRTAGTACRDSISSLAIPLSYSTPLTVGNVQVVSIATDSGIIEALNQSYAR
ncbi:hypothetical protein F4780DRAFT_439508 [Xylariomycetidae sp. FL0641]|nr:hypothetical protein F4780DRAFT_439508 [Xylariomycetidae sp. FL0641]